MVGTLNSRQDYNSHAFLFLLKTCRTATIGFLPLPWSSFPSSVPLNTWYFPKKGGQQSPGVGITPYKLCNRMLRRVTRGVEELKKGRVKTETLG